MRFRPGLYGNILPGEEREANAARRARSKTQQKGYEISGLALVLICLGLGSFQRVFADGFLLPSRNAGTWGQSPAVLVAEIETALKTSGFLDAVKVAGDVANQIGRGQVPMIDDLAGVIEGDVQNRVQAAVVQANEATQLLARVDVEALRQLFEQLKSTITTPQEFAVTVPGGRLVFRRDLTDVSLCAVIAGPGGARVTLGVSNGAQLGGNPAPRFVNPTLEPVLFADLALGYSHLQARRKLQAVPPVGPAPLAIGIQAATYFKIHDNWVQLRLAGNDPESLSLKLTFVVGVRIGFSDEIQAEVEGQMLLELEVKPAQVATMLPDITAILKNGLGSNTPASPKAAAPAVAGVLKQVSVYLKSLQDRGEEIGELSVSMATDAGIGVGAWDTGINILSVGAQTKIGVPLEAVLGLSVDRLAAQLEAGLKISTQLQSLFVAMSEGRLDAKEMQRQLTLVTMTARDFALELGAAYPSFLTGIHVGYETGLYGLGDIGQAADQTIPILVMTAKIPVGQMATNLAAGEERFVASFAEAAKASSRLAQEVMTAGLKATDPVSLGKIIRPGGRIQPPTHLPIYTQRPRGTPPVPMTAADWKAMGAGLLDDVTFSFRFGALGLEGASMGNLVRLMGGATDVAHSIFSGAVQSAVAFNEKPLLDALRAAPGQVGHEAQDLLIFNLEKLGVFYDNSLGASGTVGAELEAGVGGAIAFDARLKASLFLLTTGNENYDEKDGTLLAGIDIPMEVSASGGIALGEGVEFTVEGGFTAGSSLGNLTLKDWGEDLPMPASLTLAGFELLDFVGTNRLDGTITGRGWLVLPQGGLVRVDHFTREATGRVREGAWSGVLELGPFGEVTIAGGSITDDGLVGQANLGVGPGALRADFLLRGNGLLFGTATGNLDLGGIVLADVRLSLTQDGSFRGTATVDIGGRPVVFQVAIEPGRPLSGSATAQLQTPWGLELLADLKLDATGVYGSGTTRILGLEFVTDNLRILSQGRVEGSFSGTLSVEGQLLSLQKLEIRGDRLQGRTTLSVAEHQGLELLLTVDASGVTGTFTSDLDLFGAGTSDAWVRITDRIEVFGRMDGDFVGLFTNLLRERLLGGIGDARKLLESQQRQLEADRARVRQLDGDLEDLKQQILREQQTVRAAAETAVKDTQAALKDANEKLNAAIDAVRAASGDLAAELDKAEAAFRVADLAFARAQVEVNKANGEIASLDRWYNGLDPVAKALLWGPYQIARGVRVAAQAAANRLLSEARNVRNLAEAALKGVQRQLANAEALVAFRDLKDREAAEARARFDEAQRDLTRIIETIADPTHDIRYLSLSLSRDAVLLLISAAEKLIAETSHRLDDATGLVEFINRNGPSDVVKINQVNFRSTLADLDRGFVELIVDAQVADQPRRFVLSHDFGNGRNQVDIDLAVRLLSPQLHSETAWTVSPWIDDASSGISPGQTLWAYQFNSAETTHVRSVPVLGLAGTAPAVGGRFSVQGFGAAFTGDQNQLTSGAGGSAVMAANFLYGAYDGTITFEGLTPGASYRATLLSAGWDDAPFARRITFKSPAGARTVEQNTYGNNHGLRIDHGFTATAATYTITLTPATDATFHLYALALGVGGNLPLTYTDWKQGEFGARSFEGSIGEEKDDPDGDGLPNFVEYALRLDPKSPGGSGFSLPVRIVLPGSVEARRFTVPYQANAGDLVYRIRHSDDLATWTDVYRFDPGTGTATQRPGVTGAVDKDRQTVTVTLTDSSLFAPPSFWSLVVERR